MPGLGATVDASLAAIAASHPYPLVFATISGAHLYGFPSPDSDFDLRGVHLLPAEEVVGLIPGRETIEVAEIRDGLDLDLVTHDARKFFGLMLKKNGYVLEQLHSPLVVAASPVLPELREIARGCVTRHHVHHYRGFAANQWKLFGAERPRRVKPLLYVFRVLLSGIWLMRTGEVQAHLPTLNQHFALPYLDELVARKTGGPEKGTLEDTDVAFYAQEFARLYAELDRAGQDSPLPDVPTAEPALHDLLVRLRLGRA